MTAITMKRDGFVSAVTWAVNNGTDNWEATYYRGDKCDWSPRRLNVYMETRRSALGPEWRELQRCIMQMRGQIPLC